MVGGDLRIIEQAVIFVKINFKGQFPYLKLIAHMYFAGIRNSLIIN